jgi:hypothetical protein
MRSRSVRGAVLGIALAALACSHAHAAAEGLRTASFTVTTVQSTMQGQVTVSSKVWVTATQARAEIHAPLNGERLMLITDGSVFQLDPKSKRGVRQKLPPELAKRKDIFDFLIAQLGVNPGPVMQKAKKVRTETVAGYPCDVYTDSQSKDGMTQEFTVWLPQSMDPKLVLKATIQSTTNKPGISAKESVSVNVSDLKLHQPIPASTFVVPKDYKIKQAPTGPPPKAGKKRK